MHGVSYEYAVHKDDTGKNYNNNGNKQKANVINNSNKVGNKNGSFFVKSFKVAILTI